MLKEVLQSFSLKETGIYIDCTFGYGGHSKAILEFMNNKSQLIALDCDPASILRASKILDSRFIAIHSRFSNLSSLLKKLQLTHKIHGFLVDLGISSGQLGNKNRGFSFSKHGPLDMRMNNTEGLKASQWLKNCNVSQLNNILRCYGEEKFALRISKAIKKVNSHFFIENTKQLTDVIKLAVPKKNYSKNVATRSFQAIRIQTNNEMQELKILIQEIGKNLIFGGKAVIISFHSLEDKLIKKFVAQYQGFVKLFWSKKSS